MKKNKAYICPKCECNEEEKLFYDYDLGFDIAIDKNNEQYNYISAHCTCTGCGHRWVEFFRLVFDGYSSNDVEYDKDGESI